MEFIKNTFKKFDGQISANNGSVKSSGIQKVEAVKVTKNEPVKFDYEKLNQLFMDEGMDALVKELEKLEEQGVIKDLRTEQDKTGRTTIFCTVDDVEYMFREQVATIAPPKPETPIDDEPEEEKTIMAIKPKKPANSAVVEKTDYKNVAKETTTIGKIDKEVKTEELGSVVVGGKGNDGTKGGGVSNKGAGDTPGVVLGGDLLDPVGKSDFGNEDEFKSYLHGAAKTEVLAEKEFEVLPDVLKDMIDALLDEKCGGLYSKNKKISKATIKEEVRKAVREFIKTNETAITSYNKIEKFVPDYAKKLGEYVKTALEKYEAAGKENDVEKARAFYNEAHTAYLNAQKYIQDNKTAFDEAENLMSDLEEALKKDPENKVLKAIVDNLAPKADAAEELETQVDTMGAKDTAAATRIQTLEAQNANKFKDADELETYITVTCFKEITKEGEWTTELKKELRGILGELADRHAAAKDFGKVTKDQILKEAKDAWKASVDARQKAAEEEDKIDKEAFNKKIDNLVDYYVKTRIGFYVGKNENIDLKKSYDSTTRFGFSEIDTIIDNIFGDLNIGLDNEKYGNDIEKLAKQCGMDMKTLVKKVLESSFMQLAVQSSVVSKEKLINGALDVFKEEMKQLVDNPDLIKIYASNIFTKDVDELAIWKGTTVSVDENCAISRLTSDGKPHLSDDTQDMYYQQSMDVVYAGVLGAYPNIDQKNIESWFRTAQKNVFSKVGKQKITIEKLIDETLRQFEKIMFSEVRKNTDLFKVDGGTPIGNPKAVDRNTSDESLLNIQSAMGALTNKMGLITARTNNKDNDWLASQLETWSNSYSQNKSGKIQLEFGMDWNGNIIFEDKKGDATGLYKAVTAAIMTRLTDMNSEEFNKIGETNFKKLMQAAWINTYNDTNNTYEDINVKDFVRQFLYNLKGMMGSISKNPGLFEDILKGTTYANTSIISDLKNKGVFTQDIINYSSCVRDGKVYTENGYDDERIHLSKDDSDVIYEKMISVLKDVLKDRYSSLDPAMIENLLRQAETDAIIAMSEDYKELPFGLGKGDNVTNSDPGQWDHDGKNNRYKDGSEITQAQYAEVILYYFDRKFYKAVEDGEFGEAKVGQTKTPPQEEPPVDDEPTTQTQTMELLNKLDNNSTFRDPGVMQKFMESEECKNAVLAALGLTDKGLLETYGYSYSSLLSMLYPLFMNPTKNTYVDATKTSRYDIALKILNYIKEHPKK